MKHEIIFETIHDIPKLRLMNKHVRKFIHQSWEYKNKSHKGFVVRKGKIKDIGISERRLVKEKIIENHIAEFNNKYLLNRLTKKRTRTFYLLAIRVDKKNHVFEFRSKVKRQQMIDEIQQCEWIEYATSEIKTTRE